MVLDYSENSPRVIWTTFMMFLFSFWLDFHCTIKSSWDIMLNISSKDVSMKQIQNQIFTSRFNVRFMLYPSISNFLPVDALDPDGGRPKGE